MLVVFEKLCGEMRGVLLGNAVFTSKVRKSLFAHPNICLYIAVFLGLLVICGCEEPEEQYDIRPISDAILSTDAYDSVLTKVMRWKGYVKIECLGSASDAPRSLAVQKSGWICKIYAPAGRMQDAESCIGPSLFNRSIRITKCGTKMDYACEFYFCYDSPLVAVAWYARNRADGICCHYEWVPHWEYAELEVSLSKDSSR